MIKLLLLCAGIVLVVVQGCTNRSKLPSDDFEASKYRGAGRSVTVFQEVSDPGVLDKLSGPPQCVENFRGFINYIFGNTPNLFFNERAQDQWLSEDLRRAAANHVRTFLRAQSEPTPPPTFPDNVTFVGAWDFPTSYRIVGARPEGGKYIIEILYIWGPGTNYEGERRPVSVIFVDEGGNCKVDDMLHHAAPYSSKFRLKEELLKDRYL